MSCRRGPVWAMLLMKGGKRGVDQKKIGNFIKQLRKEQGITQEQFAEKLGVSGRTVSRWETGSNMPDISLLVEIAEILDASIPEIINGERKNEDMEKEVREVAEKLSDYADEEKKHLLKRVEIICIVGLSAMAAEPMIESVFTNPALPVLGYLRGVCRGLTAGALITVLLYTTGLLARIRRKKSENMKILLVFWVVVLLIGLIASIAASVG